MPSGEKFSEGFRPLWLLWDKAVDLSSGYINVIFHNLRLPPEKFLSRFLDLNGDGTGNKIATGDYSVNEEIFFIQPPPGQVFEIHRLIITIVDNGKFAPQVYGAGALLPIGITVRVDNGSVVVLTNLLIRENSDWGSYCYDLTISNFPGGDDNYALVRWSLDRAGVPINLIGDDNDRLEIVLNDDFTFLLDHRFMAQGHIR